MRKYLRQIAKARLAALGAGNVNKKLRLKDQDGNPNWRRVLFGDLAGKAHSIQMSKGIKSKRKLRRIEK